MLISRLDISIYSNAYDKKQRRVDIYIDNPNQSKIENGFDLYFFKFKSLFLPRVAEIIYIEGDHKRVCLLLEL